MRRAARTIYVPGKGAAEASGSGRTGEEVGFGNQLLPARSELNLVKPAVSSCKFAQLKAMVSVKQIRMAHL